MTIIYHDASEQNKVTSKRKKVRPTYYDANLRQETSISEDFEAALILIPDASREEAHARFNEQSQDDERRTKRDGILKAALQIELQNATAQDEELQQSMTQFQNFKSEFSVYASVGEIALLLRDAQLDMDEKVMAADRARHRMVCAKILTERLNNNGVSDDLKKERDSWSSVLTAYTGV